MSRRFNSQMTELKYFEGTVWYKRTFNYNLNDGKRLFLHFGAVNYFASIYLNGNLVGKHEGGFTHSSLRLPMLSGKAEIL